MIQRIQIHRMLAVAGCAVVLAACRPETPGAGRVTSDVAANGGEVSTWNASTVYFLLLDRFRDGNTANDTALGRRPDGGPLRSFLGGDLEGVRQKVQDGWFDSLGVDMIWTTPFVEQIHGAVDEGTGRSYGFHGYWTRDWTRVDPAFGTEDDLRALVAEAHRHGIRVLMDAVVNHTGPVTPRDPAWPDDWVRTEPECTYQGYLTSVRCRLATLPDLRTESDTPVELPDLLREKWRTEGRLEQEEAELDAFFARTGYPRAPRFYVIKWLTDWIRDVGIDGYRVDTAKHFEASVSDELRREADVAYASWKDAHPDEVLDDRPFYMVGEVYGYKIEDGRMFDYGDRTVDFFAHGYDALVNFAFKDDAHHPLEDLFASYDAELQGPLTGKAVLNYVSSHDDQAPYDLNRSDPLGAGTRLMLAPGAAQIYYGDELARPLQVAGAQTDANLRSPMDWSVVDETGDAAGARARAVLTHWRKLGRFRHDHPAVGAGAHRLLQEDPLVFARERSTAEGVDRVVIGLDQPEGSKTLPVADVFADGTAVLDAYSGTAATVVGGRVTLDTPFSVVLLAPAG